MTEPTYLMNRRTHLTWTRVLEPLEQDSGAPVELPLLGTVSAGLPLEVAEARETIAVPPEMARGNSFALRVRGHSMVDEQIQDGDIVIVARQATAANGEQATLKRFYAEPAGIRLQPANPEMEPIWLRHGDIQILGS